MEINERDYSFMLKVQDAYLKKQDGENNSIRAVSIEYGLSRTKVRKILITLGTINSPLTEKALALKEEGKNLEEIADILACSISTVSTYLPYDTVIYNGEEKSSGAIRHEKYRERNKIAAGKQVIQKEMSKEDWREPMKSREFKALKLRLSLNIEDADMDMLKKYGKVKDGIIRDIIVPANMTLHALHYAIQKAFGWQNSHLHHFELPKKCFLELTQGMFMSWADCCGLYFRFPNDDLEDLYWDDDYNESVSVKTWLKRKYTGIYQYHGISEHFMEAKDALYSFMNENQTVKVTPPFGEWMRMPEVEKKKLEKHPRMKKIEDVTLSEFRDFFMESGGPEELLERLTLKELLGEKADDEILRTLTRDAEARYKANSTSADNEYEYWRKMTQLNGKVLPLTKELLYKYDSGDNWEVKIELLDEYCSDDTWDHPNKAGFIHTPVTDEQFFDDQTPMFRNGEIIEGELRDQIATVITQMKPRCVAIDGLPVLDDVGGIGGYCEMLGGIHGIPSEHYDYTDPEETKEWARMLGWTGRINKPETVL